MTAKNERFFVGPQLDTFPGDIIQKIHKAGVKILLGSDMEKAFHDDPLAMMDYIKDGFETICKLDIGESYKQTRFFVRDLRQERHGWPLPGHR